MVLFPFMPIQAEAPSVVRIAPAVEIAVESPQRHAARAGRLPHADARAAGAFEHARAGADDIGKRAVRGDEFEHLFGTRRDRERNVFRRRAAFEYGGGFHKVVIRRIGA